MKNVVFGVYRFLGFHLCSHLLESGQEVTGYDWQAEEDEVEEKRQIFGRNANYSYFSEPWETNEKIQLYICLYDYIENPAFTSEQFQQLIAYIDGFMKKLQKNEMEIFVFLQAGYQDSLHCIISEWRLKIEQNYVVRYVYVSELYGPWIPPYKPVMNILKKDYPVLKSNMSKYIYIDDFLRSWKDIKAIQKKEIYVEGKQADSWKKDLLLYADEKDLDFSESVASTRKNIDIFIEANTSLGEGIEFIKSHNEKLEMLRNWNS